MVNQNQFTMKQPELGKQISALRKARGLTQEELVSKCNINVRTIQRIESGEVTPRSYTVKIILEAMEYDLNTIQLNEREEISNTALNHNTKLLKTSFFLGIVYFGLAFIESFLDLRIWGFGFPLMTFHDVVSLYTYLGVKISVAITFSFFMIGYFKLSTLYPNATVKTSALILAGLTWMSISVDVYSFYTEDANEFVMPMQAILFGMVYVVFGIGLLKYRNVFGNLALAAGITGVVCGIFLMTVVLAIPGLIVVAAFEILLLILLYRAVEGSKPDPTPMTAV